MSESCLNSENATARIEPHAEDGAIKLRTSGLVHTFASANYTRYSNGTLSSTLWTKLHFTHTHTHTHTHTWITYDCLTFFRSRMHSLSVCLPHYWLYPNGAKNHALPAKEGHTTGHKGLIRAGDTGIRMGRLLAALQGNNENGDCLQTRKGTTLLRHYVVFE